MRRVIPPEAVDHFINEVRKKIEEQIDKKGSNSFITSHEILGVISEEFDELKDSVRNNDKDELKKELYDIAVGAIWGICSIDYGLEW